MRRNGKETKKRIERQALGLFVQKGVTETTMRDIAAASGLTEGAIYRHFVSKDELAWSLFADNFSALARELRAIVGGQETFRAKLTGLVDQVCRAFDDDGTLFTYLLLSEHQQVKKITPDMDNPVEVLRQIIRSGLAGGEIPKQDPEVAAAMVLGIVLQVAKARLYGRIEGRLSDRRDQLVEACCRALRA